MSYTHKNVGIYQIYYYASYIYYRKYVRTRKLMVYLVQKPQVCLTETNRLPPIITEGHRRKLAKKGTLCHIL